jgi:hypothetical protein
MNCRRAPASTKRRPVSGSVALRLALDDVMPSSFRRCPLSANELNQRNDLPGTPQWQSRRGITHDTRRRLLRRLETRAGIRYLVQVPHDQTATPGWRDTNCSRSPDGNCPAHALRAPSVRSTTGPRAA